MNPVLRNNIQHEIPNFLEFCQELTGIDGLKEAYLKQSEI
jgi:hypothetical protein